MNQPRDKGLNGNEKIEQAVAALQQEPTQEQPGPHPYRDPAAHKGAWPACRGGGAQFGQ